MNWVLLQNSLLAASLTTAAALFLGLIAAVWTAGLSARWRNAVLIVAAIAFVLPPFLVTSSWIYLLGETGIWRRWLPVSIYSLWGTVWVLSLLMWPIPLFLVSSVWTRLEQAQIEADLALKGWLLFRWLLLPMARPALVQAALITFVLAFNNFAVPAILQTRVFPAELWVNYSTHLDYTSALKLSVPLVLAPVLLFLILSRWNIAWPAFGRGIEPRLFREQLGSLWTRTSGAVTLGLIAVSAGLPLIQLFGNSKTWMGLLAALPASGNAAMNSFLIAASVATICVLASLCVWRWRIAGLVWICFLLPGVFLGISLIFVFNRPGFFAFYQSFAIVLLGLAFRYVALSWHGTRRAMRETDADLNSAALLDGASVVQRLRHVVWPQIAPSVAACWYITYLLCLWDAETLLLIVPPGGETLALRIFNLLHYGYTSQVNALCIVLFALALAPGLCWAIWKRAASEKWRISTMGCAVAMMWMTACGPMAPNEAAVNSALFSKVQVIGTRGTAPGQFNKPRSLAVDTKDNLYVVDMTGRVQKFTSNGVYVLSWQMPQTDKGKPKGMGCDSQGNIIVIEPHYSRINHYSPDGKLLKQWGEHGTNAGQLTLPRSVAVNAKGEVLVSEYTVVDRVQVFSAIEKQFPRVFGKMGRGPGDFNRAEGLAVDNKDRIYVADSCNHRVQVFSPDGVFIRKYGRAGTGPGELSYPYDVKIDERGYEFVCEFGNSRVQIFNENGQSVEILGGAGSAPGQFNNPWAIALDSMGNLYVADALNHRVQKFVRHKS